MTDNYRIVTPFQDSVFRWLSAAFDRDVVHDVAERNYRFLEEALELVQARALSRDEAHRLVDWVFDKPAGDPKTEAGDALVCLAALCHTAGYDMEANGEATLARCWQRIDAIRAKQKTKPRFATAPPANYPTQRAWADCPYVSCPSPRICKPECKVVASERLFDDHA